MSLLQNKKRRESYKGFCNSGSCDLHNNTITGQLFSVLDPHCFQTLLIFCNSLARNASIFTILSESSELTENFTNFNYYFMHYILNSNNIYIFNKRTMNKFCELMHCHVNHGLQLIIYWTIDQYIVLKINIAPESFKILIHFFVLVMSLQTLLGLKLF